MQLELVDIALRGHMLAMHDDFLPAVVDWSKYTVETKAGVASWKMLPKEGDQTLARFVVTTGLRWTSADIEGAAATVEAEYGLLFIVPEGGDIAAQGKDVWHQVLLAAWPYWRQDFLQMATKASLPLISIPTNPDFEPETSGMTSAQ